MATRHIKTHLGKHPKYIAKAVGAILIARNNKNSRDVNKHPTVYFIQQKLFSNDKTKHVGAILIARLKIFIF